VSEIFEPWEARDLAGLLRLIAIHFETNHAAAAAFMRYLYPNPLAPARQAHQITAQLRTAADRLTAVPAPATKDETR
jgi:hypothetical protein